MQKPCAGMPPLMLLRRNELPTQNRLLATRCCRTCAAFLLGLGVAKLVVIKRVARIPRMWR